MRVFSRQATILVVLAYLFSFFAFAEAPTEKSKNRWRRPADVQLENFLKKYFNAADFDLSSVSVSEGRVTGLVTFFGVKGVQFTGTTNGDNRPQKIEAVFPANAVLNLGSLNRLTENKIRDFLPRSVSPEAGIQIVSFSIEANSEGTEIAQFQTLLKSNAWDFMNFGGLKMEGVEMRLLVNPKGPRKLSGTVSGNVALGSGRAQVSAELPDQVKDLKVEGSFSGLGSQFNLLAMLQGLGGEDLVKDMGGFVPNDVLKSLKIPDFRFTAIPSTGTFTISSLGETNKTSLVVVARGTAKNVTFSLEPDTNFKFASLDPKLGWLDNDKISFTNVFIQVSNTSSKVKGSNRTHKPGIVLAGEIAPSNEMKSLLLGKANADAGAQLPKFILNGSIDAAYNAMLAMEQQLKIDLGKGVTFEGVNFTMENNVTTGGPKVGMDGSIVVPVESTKLRFVTALSALPTTLQFGGGITLQAVGDQQTGEWQEPFGIPYITVVHLGGSVKLNPYTIISEIGFNGRVKLGKLPAPGGIDRRINIGIDTLRLNILTPGQSEFKMSLENTTIIKMIHAFYPELNVSPSLEKMLNSGIEKAVVNISPADKKFFASGDIVLFGHKGNLNFNFDKTNGFQMAGSMQPITIKAGDLTILSVRGVERPDPNFSFNFSSNFSMRIDGKLEVLGIVGLETLVKIDEKGYDINAKGNLFGGALAATVKVKGQNFGESRSMILDVKFEQTVSTAVQTSLVNFIKDQAKDSDRKIRDAQKKLQDAKRGQDDVSKFFIDGADGFLSGINSIQGEMAVAGVLITKGVLSGLVVNYIQFQGSADMVKIKARVAVGVTVMGQFKEYDAEVQLDSKSLSNTADLIAKAIGNDILKAFAYLEKELANIAAEFEEFGKQFVKTFEDVGKEAEKAFNTMGQGFEQLGAELDKMWNGRRFEPARAGSPLDVITPGTQHFIVTIKDITVLAASDCFGCGSDLEIWGAVTIYGVGNVITPKGANGIGWSRNRPDGPISRVVNQSININHSKHFYVPPGGSAKIEVRGYLFEEDGLSAMEDDAFSRNGWSVNLINMAPRDYSFESTEGDSRVRITFNVAPQPMMTTGDVVNAVRSGNIDNVRNVVKKGGDLRAAGSQAMDAAIQRGDSEMMSFLIMNNIYPNHNHLDMALRSNNLALAERIMIRGTRPNTNDLAIVVDKGNLDMAALMIANGAQPNLAIFNQALQKKDYKMAALIADKGAKPGPAEFTAYVNSGDVQAVELIKSSGVKATKTDLETTIRNKNRPMYELIHEDVQPDASFLKVAAEGNDAAWFRDLGLKGCTSTDAQLSVIALSKNNLEMFDLSMDFGVQPTQALGAAMQAGNANAVYSALNRGGNPNTSLAYAVSRNDIKLFGDLVGLFGADGNAAMAEAVKTNNAAYVTIALRDGNANPDTYLASYSDQGNEQMTRLLLDYGGNPNLAMNGAVIKGNTRLASDLVYMGAKTTNPAWVPSAVQQQNLEMVKILVDNGADANQGISQAVNLDNYPITEYLLQSNASPGNLIGVPAAKGNLKMVNLFLSFNANPNDGMPGAVQGLHYEVAKALLSAGASPKGHVASPASKGNLDFVKLVVSFGGDANEGMRPAVDINNTAIVRFLLQSGASAKGYIATAAAFGNLEVVNLLLDGGDTAVDGMMPAVDKGHALVVSRLIEVGVDASKDEYIGRAVTNRHIKVAEILFKNGAKSTGYRDGEQKTILHIAGDVPGNQELVKLILANAPDLEAVDNDGFTPLARAAKEGNDNLQTVIILVEAGCDVNACTGKDRSVFQVARGGKVKDYLKEKGAGRKDCK